jgi:hypothetical protein
MMSRPRRNRVNPFGGIEAVPFRDTLMGNRGDLHGVDGLLAREWHLRRWISCVLNDGTGRRVTFDTPGTYTPLFFLDEAVALAAGHRPCAHCRKNAYRAFRYAWQAVCRTNRSMSAAEIDSILHPWRIGRSASINRFRQLTALPAGVMVSILRGDDRAFLWTGSRLMEWSHGGYSARPDMAPDQVYVLTPPPIVDLLQAGYEPEMSVALNMHRPDAARRPALAASDTGRTQHALL